MGSGPVITGSVCALACAQAAFLGFARQLDTPGHEACPRGWLGVAFFLLLSACFHFFSFDMVGADFFRQWLTSYGGYGYRRPLQFLALALLGLMLALGCFNAYRQMGRGVCFWTWVCFVMSLWVWLCAMVRLVSWHHSDVLMSWPLGGLSLGRWAELSALAVVLLIINSRLLVRWSYS